MTEPAENPDVSIDEGPTLEVVSPSDPMQHLALELLKQNREGHKLIVRAVNKTSEISAEAINGLRESTASEASSDRESNRKDNRQMMMLIALFGALIAALSGLNIMFDGSGVGAPSLTIEGTPEAPPAPPTPVSELEETEDTPEP